MRVSSRRDRRAVDDAVALRGDARALQVVLELLLHRRGLLDDQPALVAADQAALVEQHRERRLQRMRQVADLRARALDDAAVVLDQRIGLVGQRLDLGRETAVEPSAPCPRAPAPAPRAPAAAAAARAGWRWR
jgi:hypothetical protein